MKRLVIATARFKKDKKEAISKNIVNIAENISTDNNINITTITPIKFSSKSKLNQINYRKESNYSSIYEGMINLLKTCSIINKIEKNTIFNLHIATPAEAIIARIFLTKKSRENLVLSIWQSYMEPVELKKNLFFYMKNIGSYYHLITLNSFILAPLYKKSLKSFKKKIVHSEWQHKQLSALGVEEINHIKNGIFSYKTPRQKSTYKQSKELKITYIGHIKSSKGIEDLIKIISSMKKRKKIDFEFSLCPSGYGNHEKLIKQLKKNNIHEITKIKKDIDVSCELYSSDLLILPLRTCVGTSMIPNLIIESLSVNTPIAIPYHCELDGVIEFGTNSLELDIASPENSAIAIENYWLGKKQKNLKEFMSSNKNYRYEFSLEEFTGKYKEELLK